MQEQNELNKSLEILERDVNDMVAAFVERLEGRTDFSEASWRLVSKANAKDWRRGIVEIMRSAWDECARFKRKQNGEE